MVSRSYPVFLNENALNVSVTTTPNPLAFLTISNLLTAFFILCGMFMVSKLFWMFWYQLKYGLGDEYLSGKLTKEDKEKLREGFSWLKLIKKE